MNLEISLNKYFSLMQIMLIFISFFSYSFNFSILAESMLILTLVLDKICKGIVFREIIALHATLLLLLMPYIGYQFYPYENSLARLWVKYMPISEEKYYSFMLPSVLIFNYILCLPIQRENLKDEGATFLKNFKSTLKKLENSNIDPRVLVAIGALFFFISPLIPAIFRYIGFLISSVAFVGVLMLFFNKKIKFRLQYIAFFVLMLITSAIQSTMFTVLIYMGMTIFSFFFLGTKWTFLSKLSSFVLFVFLVLLLQNAKLILRTTNTSQKSLTGFAYLFYNQINTTSSLFEANRFFPVYIRLNQGLLVAKVIKYVPASQEPDNGTYLARSIMASILPRFIWPDKPQAGGSTTLKYFTGEVAGGTTSMNVSPFGEAYGSFGYWGGILYIMILGVFIRNFYLFFLFLAKSNEFLIFWLPVVFYQVTYSMESDSLQIFNSLFKSALFVLIISFLFPFLIKFYARNRSMP